MRRELWCRRGRHAVDEVVQGERRRREGAGGSGLGLLELLLAVHGDDGVLLQADAGQTGHNNALARARLLHVTGHGGTCGRPSTGLGASCDVRHTRRQHSRRSHSPLAAPGPSRLRLPALPPHGTRCSSSTPSSASPLVLTASPPPSSSSSLPRSFARPRRVARNDAVKYSAVDPPRPPCRRYSCVLRHRLSPCPFLSLRPPLARISSSAISFLANLSRLILRRRRLRPFPIWRCTWSQEPLSVLLAHSSPVPQVRYWLIGPEDGIRVRSPRPLSRSCSRCFRLSSFTASPCQLSSGRISLLSLRPMAFVFSYTAGSPPVNPSLV